MYIQIAPEVLNFLPYRSHRIFQTRCITVIFPEIQRHGYNLFIFPHFGHIFDIEQAIIQKVRVDL
ncbi:hypothetical protein D3C72_2348180 [compost metagenome]